MSGMCKRACVFVTPCMLAPAFQAESSCDTANWGIFFIETALRNNIDIHVLPCTETLFLGLDRKKHGIDYYSNLAHYKEFCAEKAQITAESIRLLCNHCNIIAIIGVEHSPSCAINYMYSHRGMLKESGLFMRSLKESLHDMNIAIPHLGVNRKYPQKSLKEFESLVQKAVNERERKKQ